MFYAFQYGEEHRNCVRLRRKDAKCVLSARSLAMLGGFLWDFLFAVGSRRVKESLQYKGGETVAVGERNDQKITFV